MALYSFCVKRENDLHFHRLAEDTKYDLQFLDYLTTQFNNKEELIKFLGFEDVKDIAITYKHYGTYQKLDVFYAGAAELNEIAGSMVNLNPGIDLGDSLANLGYAYMLPKTIEVTKTIPTTTYSFKKVYNAFLKNNMPNVAFRTNRLHSGAHKYYQMFGDSQYLLDELCKSYLNIRKIYMSLLENGYLQIGKGNVYNSGITLKDIEGSLNGPKSPKERMFSLLMEMKTSEYEDMLIHRILMNDEDAMGELMANDTIVLERFQEFLALLPEYMAFMKHENPQKRL